MKEKDISILYKDLKPNYEISKSSDFHCNSPDKKKKTFFIRKFNEKELSNENISKEFNNYFFNPDSYFSKNSPFRIGKKTDISEISIEIKNTNKKITMLRRNMLNTSNISRKKSTITKLSKDLYNNNIIDNSKFEIIDNKKLDDMFNSYKKLINFNNKKYSTYKLNHRLPISISLSLDNQEKNLLSQKNNNKKNDKILNYLSNKIHENKDDLLMNKIDSFLYKKEFLNKRDNNLYSSAVNDRFKWTTSLRNPSKFKGIRKTLVNINTDKYPFWGLFVEKSPNMRQTSVRPGINLNNRNLQNFIKMAKSVDGINEKKLKNLDEINVKGENLLNLEYNREMSSKRKKILHKAFLVNGKVVINTEINNAFGKETFYKNYEKNKRIFSPFYTNQN